MKPPSATASTSKGAGGSSPAVFLRLETLKNRADFLKTAKGQKCASKAFILQARDRNDDSEVIRVGFTCSKKVGNAVARNRAKRRLREIARSILPIAGKSGWDYVLVGRHNKTETLDFEKLLKDFKDAVRKVHS